MAGKGRSYADERASDGIEEVLELSRQEYLATSRNPVTASSSHASGLGGGHARLKQIDSDIANVERQLIDLQAYLKSLVRKRDALRRDVASTRVTEQTASTEPPFGSRLNYATDRFPWAQGMKDRMQRVFGIDNFRLCQEAVCNANLDNRDIIVVMPTGGGKSLTYQLPALLSNGCTVVISPLVSLITDQVLHLTEAGVPAVMFPPSMTGAESGALFQRLESLAGQGSDADSAQDLKLCYVTPEKVSKSKKLITCLTTLYKASKLARIVVDEAHCVSQYGHNFRPDYKELSMLRELFPNVPIMALSATCPPPVLKDVQKILRLQRELVSGYSATPTGTLYFSSPLYRKNLHYAVLPKRSSTSGQYEDMVNYILQNHAGHSGIVYCFTKTETENVAQALYENSHKKIRTGVYHADIPAAQKEQLHHRWRRGEVQVVCATIAFGMGIDKGDVRFVIHHSISKSLDGYYQESGRAGRDGEDADCVLYYRPLDGTRMRGMTYRDLAGRERVHAMLCFAQDISECRKILFAKYFSVSANEAIASWTTNDEEALTPCGHCDNCKRSSDIVDNKDVTLLAWRILKITSAVATMHGKITLNKLVSLVRGNGGGKFDATVRRGKRTARTEEVLDIEKIAGGVVQLSPEDTERLCVHLILEGHLTETFEETSYTTNVHVTTGVEAQSLLRFSSADIEAGKSEAMNCLFLRKTSIRKASKNSRKDKRAVSRPLPSIHDESDAEKSLGNSAKKRKGRPAVSSEGSEVADTEEEAQLFEESGWVHNMKSPPNSHSGPSRKVSRVVSVKRQKVGQARGEVTDGVITISSDESP